MIETLIGCVGGECKTWGFACPYGCYDGACLTESSPQATCTDSEGGTDRYNKGTCTDSAGTHTDYCDGNTVRDYYCSSGACTEGGYVYHG